MYNHRIRAMVTMEINIIINAKNETSTPRDTVKLLIERYGEKDAKRMIAMLVNAVSPYDGRIWDYVRDWAKSVKSAPTHEELEEIELYGVDSYIHSAHVNQIGQAMYMHLKESEA